MNCKSIIILLLFNNTFATSQSSYNRNIIRQRSLPIMRFHTFDKNLVKEKPEWKNITNNSFQKNNIQHNIITYNKYSHGTIITELILFFFAYYAISSWKSPFYTSRST